MEFLLALVRCGRAVRKVVILFSALDERCCSVVSHHLPSSYICVSTSNWLSSHILGYLGERSGKISISVAGWQFVLRNTLSVGVSEIQSGGKLTKLHLQWKPVR